MSSSIREFVMNHPLFSHHDHHENFEVFEKERANLDFTGLLGYAAADLVTAAGAQDIKEPDEKALAAEWWDKIRTTGYGRATDLGCRALFGIEYKPENFTQITEALQAAIKGKTAQEVYDYFVKEKANNKWVLQDGLFCPDNELALKEGIYPDYYRFALRSEPMLAIENNAPVEEMERLSGVSITTLDKFVESLNTYIDKFKATGRLASFKIAMAYRRDLVVSDPTHHEAQLVFNRISKGLEHSIGRKEGLPLSDYMFHRFVQRACDDDIPVQIHTGYLAGNWEDLKGRNAINLIPVLTKYKKVRFDIFHASWPWTSEFSALAKEFPNAYPDLCWAWAMNPAQTGRALSELLDAVPFNKIFGYGADTGWPWNNAGYSIQARTGIARVLERKVESGDFSETTAQEVAGAIMLRNGQEFYGLS